MKIYPILLAATLLLCPSCATGSADSSVSQSDMTPHGALLGKTRAQVNQQVTPHNAGADGWVTYPGALKIQFDAGRATALVQKVPAHMNCRQAAHWAGFKQAHAPLLRKGRCIWPADDPVHRLGPGLRGTLDLNERTLTASMTP